MNFREETRAWLEASCPASMRTPIKSEKDWIWGGRDYVFPSEDARIWMERMAERGWTVPSWPREYGGGGLSDEEAQILQEEMSRLGCRDPLKSFGIWMLGPVLLSYGNEEQRKEHLPKIARGQIRWCQGYSEPNAGSDLASLQCRARLDGDHYVVDGQKVWTSHADDSDWIFCLVRTNPEATKHEGIGFLLIDMRTPGIRVRPIRLISGASPFCETFFDNVRVPAKNLVGAPNQGWTIAKSLLKHERSALAKLRDAATDDEEPLEKVAQRYGTLTPILRDRITQANMDFLCNRYLLRRGQAAPSLVKLYAAELNKRRRELRVLAMGWQGVGMGDAVDEKQATHDWLRSRANSIEGGTSEIQLNIIAKQVLGLPE